MHLVKSAYQKSIFLFLNQIIYCGSDPIDTGSEIVGTQKNRLNETVLLNTQNICLN